MAAESDIPHLLVWGLMQAPRTAVQGTAEHGKIGWRSELDTEGTIGQPRNSITRVMKQLVKPGYSGDGQKALSAVLSPLVVGGTSHDSVDQNEDCFRYLSVLKGK